MSQLSTSIADLALILICVGVMILLFKKLKQPLVLGYVVAGFPAGPHMPYTPSMMDTANIRTWTDIGVIFLLFALGLEFSFKKIVKVGSTVVIAACAIIFCMILLGVAIEMSFGWQHMDSLFLGRVIAISSTIIIYKAFDDLGLRKKQFTSPALSILILEGILAIVLMVMLSTMAVSDNFEGTKMLSSIDKLLFFLILWFVVGIYAIPEFLKHYRKLISEKTLLIVPLALCFGMVAIAANTGFSTAFGASIMGSILAETIEAESIDRLVKPVKDLFGAIFFVSVGMMVDPTTIVEYAVLIIAITLAVILDQAFSGTMGIMLVGQPLKTAMQCGFSLTQIGEFAFIIASLGLSLHMTSDFLYPTIVAVSAITTFLTPYMIRTAESASNFVDRKLPESWRRFLMRYTNGSWTVSHESLWRKLLFALARILVVYSIVSISVTTPSFRFAVLLFREHLPGIWGPLAEAVFTILCISPFLWAIMVKKNHSVEFTALWNDNRISRGLLVSTIVLRVAASVLLVMFVITRLFKASVGLVFGVALLLVILMVLSWQLKKRSILIKRKFLQNLRSRDMRAEYLGEKKPVYAGRLLSRNLHLTDFEIPGESAWTGKTLLELNLGKKYRVHAASILRGKYRINIPGGFVRLFPMDKIQVIGTNDRLNTFTEEMSHVSAIDWDVFEKNGMTLKQLLIDTDSASLGKALREPGIRDKYHCLVAGVERGGEALVAPDVNILFEEGDVVWVVGENEDVYRLIGQNCDKKR